jgi:feruloyl esterase
MVAWVENGTVPDNLTGYRPADTNGARAQRLLCPYPAKAVYTGSGDVDLAESYSCSG